MQSRKMFYIQERERQHEQDGNRQRQKQSHRRPISDQFGNEF